MLILLLCVSSVCSCSEGWTCSHPGCYFYVHVGVFAKGNGASSVRAGCVYDLQHWFILVVAVIDEARSVVLFVCVCVCAVACIMLINVKSMSILVLLRVNPIIVASALNSIAVYVHKYACPMIETPQSYNEDSVEGNSLSQDVPTSLFSMQCIQFVQPFVLQLDTLYSDSGGGAAGLRSSVQHSCLAVLLQVLQLCSTSQTVNAMELVVQCRYGFLPMIEWTPSVECGRQQYEDKKGLLPGCSVTSSLYFSCPANTY